MRPIYNVNVDIRTLMHILHVYTIEWIDVRKLERIIGHDLNGNIDHGPHSFIELVELTLINMESNVTVFVSETRWCHDNVVRMIYIHRISKYIDTFLFVVFVFCFSIEND